MRLRHPDGSAVHLAYCTNVHPAEDLAGILAQLDTYAVPVRDRARRRPCSASACGWPRRSPPSWPPTRRARRGCARELDARGLEVVTLNGFPYEAFQAPVVKHAVYHPDWTTAQRLDVHPGPGPGAGRPAARRRGPRLDLHAAAGLARAVGRRPGRRAAHDLDELAEGLAEIERRDRPHDPGGLRARARLRRGDHRAGRRAAVPGWTPTGSASASTWPTWPAAGRSRPTRWRGCAAAGLPVVKVQVSAALEAADPRAATRAALASTSSRVPAPDPASAGGRRRGRDDLDEALAARGRCRPAPWRVHYHVPLHADPEPPLRTHRRPVLRDALAALLGGPAPVCDHLDVETYTWGVLPAARGPATDAELAAGIAAELRLRRATELARPAA